MALIWVQSWVTKGSDAVNVGHWLLLQRHPSMKKRLLRVADPDSRYENALLVQRWPEVSGRGIQAVVRLSLHQAKKGLRGVDAE